METQRKLICIESGRKQAESPDPRPQPPASARKKGNQWTRIRFLEAFCLGSHPRTIATTYRRGGLSINEADVLAEIRERVIYSGVLDERKAA